MVAAVAGVLACTGTMDEAPGSSQNPSPPASTCSPDAESIRTDVFVRSCAGTGCHGSDVASLGLDFVSAPADALVGRSSVTCDGWALVVPGSPETSFLYQKLVSSMPECGLPMPVGSELPQGDIDCIGDWIESLAEHGCETCGGETCVSLASDRGHCGSCGNVCPEGIACLDGTCACANGNEACDGVCVDTRTDTFNCGGCGTACGAGSTCEDGECSCPEPLDACSGSCADLDSDASHCGSCDAACADGQVCLMGACADGCGALEQCGSSCVDTQTNVLHCGECDHACPGGVPCVDGACSCPDGGTLCGRGCVDLQSDPTNCGSCGNACGAGDACKAGSCGCDVGVMPSFKDDIEPILNGSCTGAACHGGSRPKEDLDLEAGAAYDELVGVATSQCGGKRLLVDPGSPSTSYLMQKLLNTDVCTGTQMPKAGQSLESHELDLIAAWICSGAPDN